MKSLKDIDVAGLANTIKAYSTEVALDTIGMSIAEMLEPVTKMNNPDLNLKVGIGTMVRIEVSEAGPILNTHDEVDGLVINVNDKEDQTIFISGEVMEQISMMFLLRKLLA
jgi:protein involved in polysaccharide export with SLBB domain